MWRVLMQIEQGIVQRRKREGGKEERERGGEREERGNEERDKWRERGEGEDKCETESHGNLFVQLSAHLLPRLEMSNAVFISSAIERKKMHKINSPCGLCDKLFHIV